MNRRKFLRSVSFVGLGGFLLKPSVFYKKTRGKFYTYSLTYSSYDDKGKINNLDFGEPFYRLSRKEQVDTLISLAHNMHHQQIKNNQHYNPFLKDKDIQKLTKNW